MGEWSFDKTVRMFVPQENKIKNRIAVLLFFPERDKLVSINQNMFSRNLDQMHDHSIFCPNI